MVATQVFIGQVTIQNVVYTHNGIEFSLKKRKEILTRYNMDNP